MEDGRRKMEGSGSPSDHRPLLPSHLPSPVSNLPFPRPLQRFPKICLAIPSGTAYEWGILETSHNQSRRNVCIRGGNMNLFGEFDMLRKLWMVAVGLLLAGAALESNAGVVATWNFESPAFTGQNNYGANSVDTSLFASGALNYTLATSGSTTATMAAGTGSPGTSMEFGTTGKGSLISGAVTGNPLHNLSGTYFILTLVANNSDTRNTFTVGFDAKNSGSAPTGSLWYYSTDGRATWTAATVQPSGSIGTTYSHFTATFGGASVTGNGTIEFLQTATGVGNPTGTLDFDNITVNAVPEPVNMALAFFGVGFVAVAAARRLARRGAKANG